MAYFPDYVRIFSLVSNSKKLFFVCNDDNQKAKSILEQHAKKLSKIPVVCGFGYMVTQGFSVRFLHPHERGIKCESDDMLWDFFDGSVPESVYVYSHEMEGSKNEELWKHYGMPDETEISDTLDSVRYTASGRYSSIESACA